MRLREEMVEGEREVAFAATEIHHAELPGLREFGNDIVDQFQKPVDLAELVMHGCPHLAGFRHHPHLDQERAGNAFRDQVGLGPVMRSGRRGRFGRGPSFDAERAAGLSAHVVVSSRCVQECVFETLFEEAFDAFQGGCGFQVLVRFLTRELERELINLLLLDDNGTDGNFRVLQRQTSSRFAQDEQQATAGFEGVLDRRESRDSHGHEAGGIQKVRRGKSVGWQLEFVYDTLQSSQRP